MRTIVRLENSNCPRCHARMLDVLRGTKGVDSVRSDFSTGCLVVDHEDDPDVLVSVISATDRAVGIATNGERVMVPVDSHEAAECPSPKEAVPASPDRAPSAATAAGPLQDDGRGSLAGSRSNPLTSEVCPVCRSAPGDGPRLEGRSGVRVLSRQRPAPGVVLRAVRLLVRAFRVAFRVPVVPR